MRQRCDPSVLIQWLSFNRPSPHFNFQFLRAVETVSELRSWCYSIDCDEACVIKKKKKRKISGKQSGIGNMAEEEFWRDRRMKTSDPCAAMQITLEAA